MGGKKATEDEDGYLENRREVDAACLRSDLRNSNEICYFSPTERALSIHATFLSGGQTSITTFGVKY